MITRPPLHVVVEYFAILREQSGVADEALELDDPNAGRLYETLSRKYGFSLEKNRCRLAINDAYCDWETPLKSGDRVVFIPPVSGG